ncbi:hypothetical protein JX266_000977 [Neoarthrinium moseri]|nr:hypothetical protein JX266_000977 [Neoarthrinium moseri]
MEQDSRSDESRERAVSSEPSSTRPNPFVDADPSARKRRRTSLAGSRSRSVETLPPQPETELEDEAGAAAAVENESTMKVDSPEPPVPSTPPHSDPSSEPPSTEPHSSKVTINLRNAMGLDAAPASPPSPTKLPPSSEDIKISVEESETDSAQLPPIADDTSSSTSVATGSDYPSAALDEDDDEDELERVAPRQAPTSHDFAALLVNFPYHSVEQPYFETIQRLVGFFMTPSQFDEVLFLLGSWCKEYLKQAYVDAYAIEAAIRPSFEARFLWHTLPELFWTIFSRRVILTKSDDTRKLTTELFLQLPRLAAHLLKLDIRLIHNLPNPDDVENVDFLSPGMLQCLGNIARQDEPQSHNSYVMDPFLDNSELLSIFQWESCREPGQKTASTLSGSMMKLVRFVESLASMVPRIPRKALDYMAKCCSLVDSIVYDSYQQVAHSYGPSNARVSRSERNLAAAVRLFNGVSPALDWVVDKSINNLAADVASQLIVSLTLILARGLRGSAKDAVEMINAHRKQNPSLPEACTVDAIANEWRFGLLSKLIMSRQMQLRVSAVTLLCGDLVAEWKKGSEAQEEGNEYLQHISKFLTGTGLVDYLLGPTCHPEITMESYNILGFLAVTQTFGPAQTDLFWQTLTSTQDPRIAEALARMMAKTAPNMHQEPLVYLVEKLESLPVEAFTLHVRDLCESVTKALSVRYGYIQGAPTHMLYLRLVQQASVFGAQGTIEHADIYSFATARLRDIVQYSINFQSRQDLLESCLQDIREKTATTTGSLNALHVLMRSTMGRDLTSLVTERKFASLLVEELESTISIAQKVGFTPVYASALGTARREFIENIIAEHGNSIESQHIQLLWHLLVGDGAACQEDRAAGWASLNYAVSKTRLANRFLESCLQEHLPHLAPNLYCIGALRFVREALGPFTNDTSGTALDEQNATQPGGPLELLWRIILTAPPQSIEEQAIQLLVNDIYVNGNSINSFPLHRARKVHFALVNRCLRQMADAARELQSADGDEVMQSSGESESAATTGDLNEQELKFIRSLAVLQSFFRTLQGKAHAFAAPDMRSLMLQSASIIEGESAELKFQSFDGNQQTDVKPLAIGRQNTAASLLASIREATGFDNYRIFYRGAPLTPTEDQICKSLEDLNIQNGLLLVKRESDVVSSPVKVKPGASPLDIEILSHFKELWEYLSMDEKLAREIYNFLVKLPADESIMEAFENADTSYLKVFPLGEPFKCLYTVHALREYLSTRRLKSQVMQTNLQSAETRQKTVSDQEAVLLKAMSLLVAAICDPNVVDHCTSASLQVTLSFHLVDNLLQLLISEILPVCRSMPDATSSGETQESCNGQNIIQFLNPKLQERLLTLLASAAASPPHQYSIDLIGRSLEALLECCARSNDFWTSFEQQPAAANVLQGLLFTDDRLFVRKSVAKIIKDRCLFSAGDAGATSLRFAEMFWPVVFELLPEATAQPTKCEEVFNLIIMLMRRLSDADSPALNLQACLIRCGELLLSHTSTEDISHADRVDFVSHGLVSILHCGIKFYAGEQQVRFPANFARKLFHRHLFPRPDVNGPLVPRVILNPQTRTMLNDIILILSKRAPDQYLALLQALDGLTTYTKTDESTLSPYRYELSPQYERLRAVRSPCGYPGLRNLSNTCYLNSLFTQLFMNPHFRKFMMEVPILDPDTHQLLHETQILFSELQDSIRRFVDPQSLVGQIMTYDESPIDIHTQMDVDEFYNLLFDRWEFQMPSTRAKKTFKSIYGGQLVQQIKSKECEHISERIEPFSAIQCDIKGIANLEESLQAYVDGEIMEGDNKYKCETCDRHVDAVKRACLKDIPDSVIFHLKRFEFNLRTLQRSKINDHFAFPTKINMQPYTVGHLSDPSGEAEPDEFELVGVLVHSGTAESGHYYSYIRQHPSATGQDPWVEFNDDSVTPWDPTHLEGSCFGGKDMTQRFDGTLGFEKVYSAYMLFYQRSSSLKRDQEVLSLSGQPCPIRFDLKPDIEFAIKEGNWGIVHRYCTNDASHIPFVKQVLSHKWDSECSEDHKVENLAMFVAIGHLDQIASRTKDQPDFQQLHETILQVCQRCPLCCLCYLNYLKDRPEAMRMLLLRNVDGTARQQTGRLLIHALKHIKESLPEEYEVPSEEKDILLYDLSVARPCALTSAVQIFSNLWESFHISLRAWPELFGTMVDFASMGKIEGAALLEEDFLIKLLTIITAESSDRELGPQYARLATTLSRRQRAPSYDNILALIEILMKLLDTEMETQQFLENSYGRLQLALDDECVPWTTEEVNEIHKGWARSTSIFVDKLIQINQNPPVTERIIEHLLTLGPQVDRKIFGVVQLGITDSHSQQQQTPVSSYLRAAAWYVQHSADSTLVQQLIVHAGLQCKLLVGMEGLAYFYFFKKIFEMPRKTEEDINTVLVKGYQEVPRWVPGLLGYMDRNVSYQVELFLEETLWRWVTGPELLEDMAGMERAHEMIATAKRLGVACLLYLRDTYVARTAQAPRDSFQPLEKTVKRCNTFFSPENVAIAADMDRQFQDLLPVIDQTRRLVVDEIEEDVSDWDNSIGSSEPMDMADLQPTGDLNDVDVQ